jgi:cobalamin biosynthetic protein CobC
MAQIVHGGGLTAAVARYGGRVEDWLDLSTGINPNMPELPEIPVVVWNRLPDRGLVDAARVAARDWYLGFASEQELPPPVLPDNSPARGESGWGQPAGRTLPVITAFSSSEHRETAPQLFSPLVGEMSGGTEWGEAPGGARSVRPLLPLAVPGTQSLIQTLPKLAVPNRAIAIISPTYGEYAHCFTKAGFSIDRISRLDDVRPDHGMLIVVNPNNPDGRTYTPEELLAVHTRFGGHLHVDEAFGDSRPELSLARHSAELPNLTVSRSFGKFFGMAGVRLGFVFSRPETLEMIEAWLGPWSVSGPALHLARELMTRDRAPILAKIDERKAGLERVLAGAGLTVRGGTELFSLVENENAAALFEHLARCHILVRKFDYRPDWLRIGLSPDEEGDRRLARVLASFHA